VPRADPGRSDYCASRHLLRNLDDACELRRNPLVRAYFADAAGAPLPRDAAADRLILERVRDDVRASLAHCSEHAGRCTHVALGRMRAALLRCDIDDQPPPAVAAELGLSERQLRRERRAAHDAFVRAFRSAPHASRAAPPATACDVATVRLAQAVELHELGQGALAQSAFASLAAHAPAAERRIEALCVAAEAELDGLRFAAAAAHLENARTLLRCHARQVDDAAARAADEHIDFVAWLLRWETRNCAGLAMQPPLVLGPVCGDGAREEARRALFVRAAAAYAVQRVEVGDGLRGCHAVQRALAVLPSLHPARMKERLAIMAADAHVYSLYVTRGADHHRFRVVEELAAAHGHVHAMLAARAQRIAGVAATGPTATGRIAADVFAPFGAAERRSAARAFAWSAQCVAQCESNPHDAIAAAKLVESIVPQRSALALMARCARANHALAARRYEDARALAQVVYDDAELAGNGSVRGIAARRLSAVALACRRRGEAQRFIREALALTERYGSPEALARTNALARRLDVA
jgi:hypothetical protein